MDNVLDNIYADVCFPILRPVASEHNCYKIYYVVVWVWVCLGYRKAFI